MYRFDEHRVGFTVNERFTRMIHQLAVAAAMCYPNRCSLIPTEEEAAARERLAQAWEPAGRYQGD